jgi:hypothetical protein
LTRASEVRKPDRLSLPHWQALLEAGVRDAAERGLPEPALAYLRACLLHADAAQWQAYGNGWSLKSGDEWRQRAKAFVPAVADAALRDGQLVETARALAELEAREEAAPLNLPLARALLGGWADDYSRFGLLCAGRELLNELLGALQSWLSAALARKPWPTQAALHSLVELSRAHACWLRAHPLTAMCFPFGGVVQLLGKAGAQSPALLPAAVTAALADALEGLVLVESSERRRRDQWVAKLREPAAKPPPV